MTDTLARLRTIVGTTSDWSAHNLVLGDGEIALERTVDSQVRAKVGDGTSPFSQALYLSGNMPTIARYQGTANPTLAPPAGAVAGDAYSANPAGTVAASWGAPAAGVAVNVGDLLVKDVGGRWNVSPNTSGYALKSDLSAASGAGSVGFTFGMVYPISTVGDGMNKLNEKTSWVTTDYSGAFAYLQQNANTCTPARLSGIGHFSLGRGSTSGAGAAACAIGAARLAVNDQDNAGTWAEYATSLQTAGRASYLHLYEGDITNLGATVAMTPQNINPAGLSDGLRLMSGGEMTFPPYNAVAGTASAAILVALNDPTLHARWQKGIVFQDGACASSAIAVCYTDNIAFYKSGAIQTAISGNTLIGTVQDDALCFSTNMTRALASGAVPGAGQQLGRHDYFNHGGGTAADADVSVRAMQLAPPMTGWQVLARNSTNTPIGFGVNTQQNNAVTPTVDNALTCGSASWRWATVYAGSGTINTSDARHKRDLGALPAPLLAAFKELLGKITFGQFLAAIAEKGQGKARKHIWLVAQTIIDTCAAHGVDAFEYGFVGEDPWMEEYAERHDVQVPALESVEVPGEEIRVVNGRATVIAVTRIEMQPKMVVEKLWNADGSPAMETLSGPGHEPLTQQRARLVQATQPGVEVRTLQRQKTAEDGTPATILSVRYDEILLGLIAALATP
jgi:hypothetical protein